MASSQIEIASASRPFGCILGDQNQRDRFRDGGNGRLSFQKNINDLVRDLPACGSSSSSSSAISISVSNEKENSSRPNPRTTRIGLRKVNAGRSPIPENEQEQSPKLSSLPRSAGNSPNMGGASCLVQMWEARLNRSQSFNQNMINSNSSSRTISGLSNTECASSQVSDTKEPAIEIENQSQLTAEEVEAESQHNSSEASENEGVRVADIIKRLTNTCIGGEEGSSQINDDQEQSREPSPHTIPVFPPTALKTTADKSQNATDDPRRIRKRSTLPFMDQQQSSGTISPPVVGEGRLAFPRMSNSPRLRGRQAIQDLLMQMERDRRSEIRSLVDREAVSKFAQKGRIQSMLRLKVLQRGLMSSQHNQAPSPPTRPKVIPSSIASTRSRFDTEAEPQPTSNPSGEEDESCSRGLHEEYNITSKVINSTILSSHPHQETEANNRSEVDKTSSEQIIHCIRSLMGREQDASKGACEVGSCSNSWKPSVDILCPDANIRTAIFPPATDEQHVVVPPVQQHDSDASEEMHEICSLNSYVMWLDPSFESKEGSCWDGNGSVMSAEEADDHSQQYLTENRYYDWFSDISRPRRYWEDRRRAWYQEVLETASEDTEIRQLLERKTVSNFLDSSFRLRMDQLMMTRISHRASPGDEESEREDSTNQVMKRFFGRQLGPSNQEEQEGTHEQLQERENTEQAQQEEEQEDIEDRNLTRSECNEVSSYFEQNPVSPQLPLPSPSPISSSSWGSFREAEPSEESEQAGSHRPPRSPFHYANNGTSMLTPSRNPPSLEMELIYDLKGHMEQLYQEMTELRKSIRCCMDMQAELQLSFKRQILSGTTKKPGNGRTTPLKKGSCCICYEMPVDSLLYRCGHMCTCIKCAQELQWGSGKCPICRAPIMDVVRAYTDY